MLYTLCMEKVVMYFFGIGGIVYLILVGSYIVARTDAYQNSTPIAMSSDGSLLIPDVYSDIENGFAIRVPPMWTIDNDRAKKAGAIFTAYAGSGSNEVRMIKVTRETISISQKQILQGSTSDFSYFMKNAKVASSSLVMVNGKIGRLFEATVNVNGILNREYALIVVHNMRPFIISGAARESLWGNYKDEILASVLSFEGK